MDLQFAQVFQTTEFIAALFGVVAGFFFTLLSDVARAFVRRQMKKRQIKKEVGMIREDSLSAIRTYIENDSISPGSKEAPLMHAALDSELLGDKDILLDAGVSIKQRRSLRSIKLLSEAVEKEYQRLRNSILDYRPKIEWEGMKHEFMSLLGIYHLFMRRVFW